MILISKLVLDWSFFRKKIYFQLNFGMILEDSKVNINCIYSVGSRPSPSRLTIDFDLKSIID